LKRRKDSYSEPKGDGIRGKPQPTFIISHELSLDRAADSFKNFDVRTKGWTKIVLKPGY
jgi:threonine dehydrogenase-like Zn-dependent dehydrogenase